jgi:hypothetical protein
VSRALASLLIKVLSSRLLLRLRILRISEIVLPAIRATGVIDQHLGSIASPPPRDRSIVRSKQSNDIGKKSD